MTDNRTNKCVAPLWGQLPLMKQPGLIRCKRCEPCKKSMAGEGQRALELLRDPKWPWNQFPQKHLRIIGYYTVRNFVRDIWWRMFK